MALQAEATMLPLPLQGPIDFISLRWRFAHLRGERLHRYRAAAVARILKLAVERSAFYRELYAGGTWVTCVRCPPSTRPG